MPPPLQALLKHMRLNHEINVLLKFRCRHCQEEFHTLKRAAKQEQMSRSCGIINTTTEGNAQPVGWTRSTSRSSNDNKHDGSSVVALAPILEEEGTIHILDPRTAEGAATIAADTLPTSISGRPAPAVAQTTETVPARRRRPAARKRRAAVETRPPTEAAPAAETTEAVAVGRAVAAVGAVAATAAVAVPAAVTMSTAGPVTASPAATETSEQHSRSYRRT